MNDILGRELKDGDLCIGMAIGRNSHGMHIGVFQGSSVVYLSYNEKYINKSCTSNTYLIENPTEQELVIKEKVLRLLKEEEEERKRKANIKTIPLSKLEIGGLYKTVQGYYYVYLGKRKVIFEDLYRNTKDEEEGNCFASVWDENVTSDDILRINIYCYSHNVDILKGNKRLTEMVKKLDLNFPLTETSENSYRYEKCRLTIE